MPPHRPQAASSEHNDRASVAVSPAEYDMPGASRLRALPSDMQFLVSGGSLGTRELENSHQKHRMAAD